MVLYTEKMRKDQTVSEDDYFLHTADREQILQVTREDIIKLGDEEECMEERES